MQGKHQVRISIWGTAYSSLKNKKRVFTSQRDTFNYRKHSKPPDKTSTYPFFTTLKSEYRKGNEETWSVIPELGMFPPLFFSFNWNNLLFAFPHSSPFSQAWRRFRGSSLLQINCCVGMSVLPPFPQGSVEPSCSPAIQRLFGTHSCLCLPCQGSNFPLYQRAPEAEEQTSQPTLAYTRTLIWCRHNLLSDLQSKRNQRWFLPSVL